MNYFANSRCCKCYGALGLDNAIVVFHEAHFVCDCCNEAIQTNDVFHSLTSGKHACSKCYAVYFAPKCAACHQPMIKDCVRASSGLYHLNCFCCAQCKKPLTNDYYVDASGNFVDRDCFWEQRLLAHIAHETGGK